MKYISFILSGLALISSTAVFAATSAITAVEVSSEAQTVAPNAVSGKITVSLKNASGETEKIDESSNKLSLVSSSGTGEFSSNADNWEKTNELTVNKNTASRSFYYKDSTEGSHTLSFVLTSGETGKEWSTTHQITIGSGGTASSTGDASTTTATTASTTATNNVNSSSAGGSSLSSHESSARVTNILLAPPFSISAGRERLGNTGAPLLFHAVSNIKEIGGVNYRWSFGDGSGGTGALISHQYQLPGLYTVVLMGTRGTEEAVSRTRVRIITPDLHIIRTMRSADGALSLVVKNRSDYECNIGRFAVRAGSSTETFAPDTIIPAQSEVSLVTGVPYQSGVPVSLVAPNRAILTTETRTDSSLQRLAIALRSLPRQNISPHNPSLPPQILVGSTTSVFLRASGESQRAGLIVVPKSKERGFLEKFWKRLWDR